MRQNCDLEALENPKLTTMITYTNMLISKLFGPRSTQKYIDVKPF